MAQEAPFWFNRVEKFSVDGIEYVCEIYDYDKDDKRHSIKKSALIFGHTGQRLGSVHKLRNVELLIWPENENCIITPEVAKEAEKLLTI